MKARSHHLSLPIITLAAVAIAGAAAAQSGGGLFPSPFVVEHGVVHTEPDGSVFATDPVTDYYGGSWIVSVRPDDSRLIVDFARREITEIKPATGSYSVLSFDRMAELQRELASLEGGWTPDAPAETEGGDERRLEIVEMAGGQGPPPKSTGRDEADALIARPGVRRLQVTRELPTGDNETMFEAWFDPQVRLAPAAISALSSFENDVLGATANENGKLVLSSLAAARQHAGGAFPFRTQRPMVAGQSLDTAGSIEDVASRIEPLAAFPVDLVSVPEGLQRAPHPLELMVAYARQEAEINALMGGASGNGG